MRQLYSYRMRSVSRIDSIKLMAILALEMFVPPVSS
jgi:hypothetical protein